MTRKKSEGLELINLIESRASGRLGGYIFMSNNRIRVDKRYLKKYLLKKLAKQRRDNELS